MNNVNLIGRIGSTPELKTTQNGKSVCSFNLAVKAKDKTNWIKVVFWNSQAEVVTRYTNKGDMIGVTGRLDVREYEVEGNKRTAFEVIVEQLHFCGGKKSDTDSTKDDSFKDIEINSDEDLPF